MARAKTATALSDPRRVAIIKLIEERGPLTQAQIAKALNMSCGQVQWHLYILERGQCQKNNENGFTYYVSAAASTQFLSDLE